MISALAVSAPIPPTRTATDGASGLFGTDGFSLGDILDAINPLHHIPFVSSLYESATGDDACAASRLVGGTLLGGPVGLMVSLFDVAFENETGKGAGETMIAALTGDTQAQAPATQWASAPAAPEKQMAAIEKPADAPSRLPASLPPVDPVPFDMASRVTERTQAALQKAIVAEDALPGSDGLDEDRAVLSLFEPTPVATRYATQAYESRQRMHTLPSSQHGPQF